MNRKETIEKLQAYNQTLSKLQCTMLEKKIINQINKGKGYFFDIFNEQSITDTSVEDFLKSQHYFKEILPEYNEKLCLYLRHIQNYTCNNQLIRMDVRSTNFSHYERKVFDAIESFYVFYGLQLSIKDLIYGQYRQFPLYINFACIITAELLQNNPEAIQYCQDVLTSANNTAILTRDVIMAIEQSDNQELQSLLTNLFLAAKHQEGLRQSIIETVDEGSLSYFIQILDVIKDNQLLRFSSVQRGIMTWIGIGYETVEQKQVEFIFEHLYDYIHHEKHCQQALLHQNPLCIYLALYCIGVKSLEDASNQAILLLNRQERHIVACALLYLKQTKHFDILENKGFLEIYQDDEWITALYISECLYTDFTKLRLDKDTNQYFFDHFISCISHQKNQQTTYTSKGFEWFSIVLYKRAIVEKLFELIQKDPTVDKFKDMLPYLATYMNTNDLKRFMRKYFPQLPEETQKEYLIKNIISGNKELSQYLTDLALSFSSQDILKLEGRLSTKKDYARANIVKILAKQSREQILESHQRLLRSSVKTIQQSAMELERLVPQLFQQDHQQKWKGKEEGYGLYQPYQKYPYHYQSQLKYERKGLLKKREVLDLSFINQWDHSQILDYFKLWDQRIQEHAHEEYHKYGSDYQIGNEFFALNYRERSLDALPLADTWRQYFQQDHLSINVVFQLAFLIQTVDISCKQIFDNDVPLVSLTHKDIETLTYFRHMSTLFNYYFYERENEKTQLIAFQLLEIINKHIRYTYYKKREEYSGKTVYIAISSFPFFSFLINCLHLEEVDDKSFCELFPIVYESYIHFNIELPQNVEYKLKISPLVLARAVVLNILPDTALFEGLLDTHAAENQNRYYYSSYSDHMLMEAYRDAYYHGRGIMGKPELALPENNQDVYQCLRQTLDQISDQFLMIEKHRLNEETVVTKYIDSLRVIRGLKYLILALHVLDQQNMKRPSYDLDRSSIFIRVMMHCYPLEMDNYEMLEKEGFSEKRLVETAMIAPQWMDMIAQVLKWDGFKEACFYFIAHMKEYNADIKKSEIVTYTDIDPLDLSDGAFDMAWCQNIYQRLGEKRMKLISQSAKFLCENAFHVRARKYADACLEKISKDVFQQQVIEKRNKDALNAYCICPIQDDQDLMERYIFLQQFLKQSKKFGAQRQASEKRCYEIALMNLARNSRFQTVTRLSWMMESEMIENNRQYLIPQHIDDMDVCLQIDSQGKNTICVKRNGKTLKSIPSKYNKNPAIEEIKRVHKLWNEQYRRSRNMLEQAMEERTCFSKEEILTIAKNPIVSPMLEKLVLYSHNHFGFYNQGQLQTLHETIDFDDEIKIAHPYDLYKHHIWHDFQSYIFEKQIVQPFKQVFRELYTKLEDELMESQSKRYTGYQIQAKKVAGILKNRKWNISYENGLERVCHHDNLIVNLYAQADWFSPSEIEAPSIDYVTFTSRKDNQPVKIQDIDDVLYSEIMRDLDMAVSVAYVGGVEPITSTSTVELRKTMIQLTCQLMHLDNVEIGDRFVNIHGQYNDYTIHLGSGNIHQKGGSTIHVIHVYSKKRGKVYLPFLDEDPMSAQILTKVIMFAKDTQIKDPSILKQIQTKSSSYSFE